MAQLKISIASEEELRKFDNIEKAMVRFILEKQT